MIKQNQEGLPIFIPPAKIWKEIRFLHEELPSFCYSWIWEARCISALEKSEFIEQLQELKSVGCVKRCEVYAKKQFQIKNRMFNVRLVSYGAPNARKMYLGPNHLAHAFDKLMFDYVFVFLETPQKTEKKIQSLIQKAGKNERKINQLKESYKSLLGKDYCE